MKMKGLIRKIIVVIQELTMTDKKRRMGKINRTRQNLCIP
jgi:hypothetical protein